MSPTTAIATASPQGFHEVAVCIGSPPSDWVLAFNNHTFTLRSTQFLPAAADPDGAFVYGYYKTQTEQGVARIALSNGAVQFISRFQPSASGIISMAFDSPWLIWTRGDSQTSYAVWSIHAWNQATGEIIDIADSRLADGSDSYGQLPLIVAGHGIVAWAHPVARYGDPIVLAELRAYKLEARTQLKIDSGQLSSPVFAGQMLLWPKLVGSQTRFEAVNADTLKPVQVPTVLENPGLATYIAGSPDYLLWADSPSSFKAWRINGTQVTTYTYTKDIDHRFQFLTASSHFLLWYAGGPSPVLDLDTGNGFDVASGGGVTAAAGIIVKSVFGKAATKETVTDTQVSYLDTASVGHITNCSA